MNKDTKVLNDNELKDVNGGMKIVIDEEKEEEYSWWKTIADFIF